MSVIVRIRSVTRLPATSVRLITGKDAARDYAESNVFIFRCPFVH